MPRKTKAEKALDAAYDTAFRYNCSGVQFDMMQLGALRRDTLALVASGVPMVTAMCQMRDKYRQDVPRT